MLFFLIGASSFIGRHLYQYCKSRKEIEILGSYYMHQYNSEWIRFDMCSDNLSDICDKYLNGRRLDGILICGANTSIDGCLEDIKGSNSLNVDATKRLIRQAKKLQIKVVYLSSEAVFDGKQGYYKEEDEANPISLYGRQKYQIEQYIIQNISEYLIFRISRAVGNCFGEKDIFGEFYEKIISNEEIVCLKDQSFCLTEVNDIAKGIFEAIQKGINGLFHLSSNNYITRYNLAVSYAEKIFNGYKKIKEKEFSEISFLDNRHINGGLCGDKLANMLGIHFANLSEILDRYASSYINMKNV